MVLKLLYKSMRKYDLIKFYEQSNKDSEECNTVLG